MPINTTTQSSGKQLHRIDAVELMRIFTLYEIGTVLIEDVHAMPGQGVTSCFNFGHSVGVTQAVASLACDDVRLVRPVAWKRTLGLDGDKNASRAMAQSLSGEVAPFKLKKHDGRAEAYLLAVLAHRDANKATV